MGLPAWMHGKLVQLFRVDFYLNTSLKFICGIFKEGHTSLTNTALRLRGLPTAHYKTLILALQS